MEIPYQNHRSYGLHTYIRNHSLSKNERLSTNIKVVLYVAFIRSVMSYVCPSGSMRWIFTLEDHFGDKQHTTVRTQHVGSLQELTITALTMSLFLASLGTAWRT
jgi:hypothetical protein